MSANAKTMFSIEFAVAPANPAEAKVMAYCKACDGEIYEGEEVYLVEGIDIVHHDSDCLDEYLRLYVSVREMTVEEALGVT